MAMDADVRLLIGVARGGADGDSEALIRKELNEIMGKIKLEAKLDSKSFGEQIRKQLDAISKNGKFYVNLSKINIGAGAIADFRRQLNTVINTLNLDKGTSITLTAEGIGEVAHLVKGGDALMEPGKDLLAPEGRFPHLLQGRRHFLQGLGFQIDHKFLVMSASCGRCKSRRYRGAGARGSAAPPSPLPAPAG